MSCPSEEELMPCGCPLNKCDCERYKEGIKKNKQQLKELKLKLKKNKSAKLLPKYFAQKQGTNIERLDTIVEDRETHRS